MHLLLQFAMESDSANRNMKHLIEMFEARKKLSEEEEGAVNTVVIEADEQRMSNILHGTDLFYFFVSLKHVISTVQLSD